MLYKLNQLESTDSKRVYVHQRSGTKVETVKIYQDNSGLTWWGFKDLFQIPYQRQAMATSIFNLFSVGLTVEDLRAWISKEKALLKGKNDPEMYEKLYAMILEKEALVEATADPVKQHLAIASVFVLGEDEPIEYFTHEESNKKMQAWALDTEAVAFFLSWLGGNIESFGKVFQSLSQIALK